MDSYAANQLVTALNDIASLLQQAVLSGGKIDTIRAGSAARSCEQAATAIRNSS